MMYEFRKDARGYAFRRVDSGTRGWWYNPAGTTFDEQLASFIRDEQSAWELRIDLMMRYGCSDHAHNLRTFEEERKAAQRAERRELRRIEREQDLELCKALGRDDAYRAYEQGLVEFDILVELGFERWR